MESVEETLSKNKAQKEFYNTKKKNLPTRIWSRIRGKVLRNIRKELGIAEQSYALHKSWVGDLTHKRVLDLGCYSGNALSIYLAENAKAYVGIDLSDVAIEKLNKKLAHLPNAHAVAMDFFSKEFEDANFDVIYAYAVLHHFKNVDNLVAKLNEKLAPKGIIVSYDPLKTSYPIWFMRSLYRPFQSDAAWEYPFGRKTLKKLENAFKVKDVRGVLGKSKWFFIYRLLPISEKKKQAWGKKAHDYDWEQSARSKKHLLKCMQLNLLLQKR